MAKFNNDNISPLTPRMGNIVTRFIGDLILKCIGWKVTGQLPNVEKIVIIGAPHTSNWDFVIAMASMLSVGLRFSWMMKQQAFFFPLGGLWKAMGGVPVERRGKTDIVAQMTNWFNSNETAWLGIMPEGTRRKVKQLRRGYLRIAYAANVPVFIIGLNGPTKEVVLDKIFELSGDMDADNAAIKAYLDSTFIGVRPELG